MNFRVFFVIGKNRRENIFRDIGIRKAMAIISQILSIHSPPRNSSFEFDMLLTAAFGREFIDVIECDAVRIGYEYDI